MSAIGDLRTYGRSVGWRCAYVVLTVIATVIVVGPDNLAWRRGFIAWPAPYAATMPVGDHLQTSYFLWLWRHALTSLSHWPWQDVFQFAATGRHCLQPFGWPLALVSVPVDLLAGPIAAYNTLVLVAFLGGAAATYALARELGASTPAAAVAGFAFAFAPFRVVRSAVHLSGMLSPLIPLSLWYAERALRCSDDRARRAAWTFALVQLSIMASGELEFALDATMLSCGYLAVRALQTPRASLRVMLAPMLALLFGAALIAGLIDLYVLRPSVAAGGRLASERAFFAPHLTDVLHRRMSWGFFERYVYPGKCIAALAILGAVTGKRAKRERAVVAAFAAVTVAAYVLALMPGLDCFPPAGRLYGAIPLLAFSRTPGRIVMIATLPLAVLAAFGVDRFRRPTLRRVVAALCLVGIVLDGPAGVFHYDPASAEFLRDLPPGATLLDLPPFDPGHFSGSGYAFALTVNPGPRPGGYNPFVTSVIREAQATTAALASAPVDACRWRAVSTVMGIRYVAIHLDLYGPHALQWPADGAALVASLDNSPGFVRLSEDERVVLYRLEPERFDCEAVNRDPGGA